jgi:hypothetical protein
MSDLLSLFALPSSEKARLEAALRSFRSIDLVWDTVTGYLSTMTFKDRDGNTLYTWTFTWVAVSGTLIKVERS